MAILNPYSSHEAENLLYTALLPLSSLPLPPRLFKVIFYFYFFIFLFFFGVKTTFILLHCCELVNKVIRLYVFIEAGLSLA